MPESQRTIMVVAPHPDDAEFGVAGSVANWVNKGDEVFYVVCTNGDKGSSDPEMTSERLARIREEEQIVAAELLGVKEVVFLRYPDGYLEYSSELRGELVRLIRKYRPELVVTADLYRKYIWHPDHRVTGRVVLDAVFPFARDRLSYPEHLKEGLQPHKVMEIYLWGSEDPDVFLDITDTFETKFAALMCHKSQVGGHFEGRAREFVTMRAKDFGQKIGVPFAEAFHRVEIPY
ncbi:PIG-L deacetylase family protein [Chloroflexota bacterium]